jgi:hypothetical protein
MNTHQFTDPESGQPWTVRVVFKGDKYGRDDCLTNDGKVKIEFYDNRFPEKSGHRGQFVTRYRPSDLFAGPVRGLSLYDSSPSWSISAAGMAIARKAALEIMEGGGS